MAMLGQPKLKLIKIYNRLSFRLPSFLQDTNVTYRFSLWIWCCGCFWNGKCHPENISNLLWNVLYLYLLCNSKYF